MPTAPQKFRLQPLRKQDRTSADLPGGQWLHSHRWRKARAAFLQINPICVVHEAVGIVEPATDVDHITPHHGSYELFWDQANWQPLCHSCHSVKTAKENGGFGNGFSCQ